MSRLRITGGSARGRVLREPVPSGVRPTTDRVREAMFSMLGQDLGGLRWLDAYGGSGIVALEAWSRGAEVVVVERHRRAQSGIRRRAEELGASIEVHLGLVERVAARLTGFDIVFADPPYAFDPVPVLHTLEPLARQWLIIEAASVAALPVEYGGLRRERARSYGRTELCIYRRST